MYEIYFFLYNIFQPIWYYLISATEEWKTLKEIQRFSPDRIINSSFQFTSCALCRHKAVIKKKKKQNKKKKTAIRAAASLVRMINTVYACSASATDETSTRWTKMTPPVRMKNDFFPSNTLPLSSMADDVFSWCWASNFLSGVCVCIYICSIGGSKSQNRWDNLINLPRLPKLRSYKNTSHFPGQKFPTWEARRSHKHILPWKMLALLRPQVQKKEKMCFSFQNLMYAFQAFRFCAQNSTKKKKRLVSIQPQNSSSLCALRSRRTGGTMSMWLGLRRRRHRREILQCKTPLQSTLV